MALQRSDRPRTEKPYRALGARVASLRKQAGMTQEELARAAHISIGYPTLIEQGRNRPDEKILRKIADVLDADYTELAILAGWIDAESDLPLLPVEPEKLPVLKRMARYTLDQLNRLEAVAGLLTAKSDPYVANRDPLSHPDILNEMQVRDDVGELGTEDHTGTHRAGQQ